jgi:hypothetical protein
MAEFKTFLGQLKTPLSAEVMAECQTYLATEPTEATAGAEGTEGVAAAAANVVDLRSRRTG